MTKKEITDTINTAYDAVEASKIGKVLFLDENGMQCSSKLALDTFLLVLNHLLPNNYSTSATIDATINDTKEDWQR